MDCQAFDSSLLDALYDELDAPTSRAMQDHSAGCASCAARIAALKATREQVHAHLEELPLPDGLEARILAAAEAAMDAPSKAASGADESNVVRLADRHGATRRTGVVAFLSRPQLAIAATFLLVAGAAAMFLKSASPAREASVTASAAESDKQDRSGGAGGAAAAPVVAAQDPSPAASAAPMAFATATPTMSGGPLALREQPPPPPAPMQEARKSPDDLAANKPSLKGVDDDGERANTKTANTRSPAFTAAKSLYDAGRYGEALPKFEALSASDPEAELYVARCLAATKGCDAAAGRYDNAARRSAGSYNGSVASLEAARCYSQNNQVTAARPRYQRLTNDAFVGGQANAELQAIDQAKATRAAPPATASAPANNTTTR